MTDDFMAKFEASSFGTPAAKYLRETVSDEKAAELVARSKRVHPDNPGGYGYAVMFTQRTGTARCYFHNIDAAAPLAIHALSAGSLVGVERWSSLQRAWVPSDVFEEEN